MKKRFTLLLIPLLCFGLMLHAQQREVSGIVTDETGESVIGAAVVIKGTSIGTTTDLDGNFSLSASPSDTLEVSSLAMVTQMIEVGNNSSFNITLVEDRQQLDEVVVVAYNTQKRSTITSSVVELKSDRIADVTTPELGSMLQGKVTGVQVLPGTGQPGSSPNIVIRGRSSINSTNDPLWVVDGVIFGNDDPKLNPNDVASISVLKDASATALYGNRGANGVILVTTKRGKIGSGPQISVGLKTGINQFNPGKFELMNSEELYELHETIGNPNPWFTPDLLNRNTDWVDLATQDGSVLDANVTFTSAQKDHNLFISGGFYNEEGTVSQNELDRYTFRTNFDYNITDKFTIKPKLYFVFDRRDDVREAPLYEAYINMPWDLPYAEDGSVVNANTSQGDEWLGRDRRNFLYNQQWNYRDERSFDVFTSFDFEYKILPFLTFISTNNVRWGNAERFTYTDPRSTSGRAVNGSLFDRTDRDLRRFTNQMLRYNNIFGDKHEVTVLGAFEFQDRSFKRVETTSENILVNGQVQSVGIKPARAEGTRTEFAQQSYLFSAAYDYDGRYFAKGSIRVDGSSAFDEDYRYGEFYSIAAGWNIHRESFFNIEQINELKLRASYGAVGNQPEGFRYLDLYNVQFQYAGILAATPSQLGTPNLTWEKAIETNFGFDARFFNIIRMSLDLYNKENSGLLYFRRLSDQTGFSGRWDNIGSITNKGIELAIAADVVNTNDFGVSLGINIGFNDNNVDELADGANIISGNTIISEGEEFGTFYLRKWLGVHPGDGSPLYELVNEDGTVTTTRDYSEATVQLAGSANHDFTGGFNTDFRYRGFSLSSNWSFAYGAELYNSSRNLFDSDGFYLQFNQQKLPDGWTRWEQPGDIATHPKPQVGGYAGSNQPSTRYLEDGSYLRLNNVRLSYELSANVLKKYGINRMNLYVTGDNLATFTKFSGVDPTVNDIDEETGVTNLGFIGLGYPVPRRYALGLNVTF